MNKNNENEKKNLESEAKVEDKKSEAKKSEDKVEDKKSDDKKSEDKVEDKKSDDKKSEDKVEDKKLEAKKSEDKVEDKKSDDKKTKDKKSDDKVEDKKSDDKKSDDKGEDKKSEDKKTKGKKSDDKVEDKKSDTKKKKNRLIEIMIIIVIVIILILAGLFIKAVQPFSPDYNSESFIEEINSTDLTAEEFVDLFSNPDKTDKNGNTPLFIAISTGNIDYVNALIDADADVNKPSGEVTEIVDATTGTTNKSGGEISPLITAEQYQLTDVAHTLIEAGADANAVSEIYIGSGDSTIELTALSSALSSGDIDEVDYLSSEGATLDNGANLFFAISGYLNTQETDTLDYLVENNYVLNENEQKIFSSELGTNILSSVTDEKILKTIQEIQNNTAE